MNSKRVIAMLALVVSISCTREVMVRPSGIPASDVMARRAPLTAD